VRQALGASRARLARQLLAESGVLSIGGGVLGLLLAVWGSRLLAQQLAPSGTSASLALALDWRVFGFTAVVAIGTALLFGTAPALRAAEARPMDAMREQGRGNSSDGRVGLGGGLVVAQVALSLVLVVGAALFLRTFTSLTSMQLGFDRDRVLVARVDASRSAVDSTGRALLYDQLQRAALAVPGVSQAAVSVITPVSGSTWNNLIEVDGMPERPEEDRLTNINILTPGWFATYGTALLAGRDFDARDREGAPLAVIVNEAFVRKHLAGANPVGRIVRQPGYGTTPARTYEIVGLARDAVYGSLRDTLPPTMYLALAQQGRVPSSVSVSVRAAAGAPSGLGRALVSALGAVDPALSFRLRTLESHVEGSLRQERLVAMLSAFFGALALLLAGVGLYGVTAYAVTRRRAELGIRMALGSTPSRILRLVMGRVVMLVAIGVLIGSAATWWLSRFVGGLLFGLTPRDPASFVAGAAILVAVGLVAGWVPARRAAGVDPGGVLREG
jgi:predicted permease